VARYLIALKDHRGNFISPNLVLELGIEKGLQVLTLRSIEPVAGKYKQY